MKKVITYGTYDLLHYGHVNLLKRAKELGDYLIVGVTTDAFDLARGKLNVQQSLAERMEAVRNTGLADEIIPEEYEGQKIDDIRKHDVDIFAIGSDWIGKFDYLNEFCNVVYLPRTEGISSTALRSSTNAVRLGIIGYNNMTEKFIRESSLVNGVSVEKIFVSSLEDIIDAPFYSQKKELFSCNLEEVLNQVNAVYVIAEPKQRYHYSDMALKRGIHVLCESPISLKREEAEKLFALAKANNCVLMEAIKTAYSLAYNRLCLLVKSGKIGSVKSIDVTCTQLQNIYSDNSYSNWGSLHSWGSIGLLPVLQLLGTRYDSSEFISLVDSDKDLFTNIRFVYNNAIASVKIGTGVKAEGELVIAGTKGYIYVPAPWWKNGYFEVRYENPENNQSYFYSVEGEGIRYEISVFSKAIQTGRCNYNISNTISLAISQLMEDFDKYNHRTDLKY